MKVQDNNSYNPVSLPHPNKLLVIEPLDYNNPYDFHSPHRHDYFEIILVKEGTGYQYIDFERYDLDAGKIFAIYPGQVHQLYRNMAQGVLIQFRKDIFEFINPVKHHDFYLASQLFKADEATFLHLYDFTLRIQQLLQVPELPVLSIHKAYSYLQLILITLSELSPKNTMCYEYPFISKFLLLITQHIRNKRKVLDYASLLGCSQDKLNQACKNFLGKTPLELIHEELLLEIRRMMVLNQLSLKEIAYELNFDSPANFSGFIKLKTGSTPSELQADILKIY